MPLVEVQGDPFADEFASVKDIQAGRATMFTPDEQASMDAEDRSPQAVEELKQAIARAQHPTERAALQDQLNKVTTDPATAQNFLTQAADTSNPELLSATPQDTTPHHTAPPSGGQLVPVSHEPDFGSDDSLFLVPPPAPAARGTPPGVSIGDYLKSFGSGAVNATGMIAQGGGEALAGGLNLASRALGFEPDFRAVNPLESLATTMSASRSAAAKQASLGAQIRGELLDPKTWDWGDNPSLPGYVLNVADTLGQFAPNLMIALATAGTSLPAQFTIGAATGGFQAYGGAAQGEREAIDGMDHDQLMRSSALYLQLIGNGVPPAQAKSAVSEAAALGGGLGNAVPSAAEGAIENVLIGMLTRGKVQVPSLLGASRAGRAVTGAIGGAAIGGAEEAVEQASQNIGYNVSVGGNRSVGDDTLSNFVGGAIGEGVFGGAAGGAMGKPQVAAPEAPPVVEAPGPQLVATETVPEFDSPALIPEVPASGLQVGAEGAPFPDGQAAQTHADKVYGSRDTEERRLAWLNEMPVKPVEKPKPAEAIAQMQRDTEAALGRATARPGILDTIDKAQADSEKRIEDVATTWGPDAEKPKNELDLGEARAGKLADPEVRRELQNMARNAGWAEIGGKIIRGEDGEVSGRTDWVPKEDWWSNRPDKLNDKQVKEAVRKALSGEKLSKPETRVIDHMAEAAGERIESSKALKYVGLSPDEQNLADFGAVEKAVHLDQDAVERLAVQYDGDDAGFMKAITEFIHERESQKTGVRSEAQPQAQAGGEGNAFARQQEAGPQTGQRQQGIDEAPTRAIESPSVETPPAQTPSQEGVSLSVDEMTKQLDALGYDVAKNGDGRLEVISKRPKDRRRNGESFSYDKATGKFTGIGEDFEEIPLPADAVPLAKGLVDLIGHGAIPDDYSESATPASAVAAESSITTEDSGAQAAAVPETAPGKEVERYAGMYKKGVTEFNAHREQKRLTTEKPDLDWRVKKAPQFGEDRFEVIGYEKPTPIDEAAHVAATSSVNDHPVPTEAQQDAGNYKKGHVRFNGLDISIENPAGSRRRPEWPELKSHYGYIRGTVGKDKDHVDVFIKPGTPLDHDGPVFVVDQKKANGHFDEHKVMIGWPDEKAARAGYQENYTKGWDGVRAITQMPMDQFKTWLNEGDTTAQASASEQAQRIEDVGEKIGGARKDISVKTGAASVKTDSEDPGWRKRYEPSQIVKSRKPEEEGRWVIRDMRAKDPWGQQKQVGRETYATKEEADAVVPILAVARNHAVGMKTVGKATKYVIWRNVTDRKRVQVVDKEFDTRDEAMHYLADNAIPIIETRTSFGEEILPRPDKVVRTGAERRKGNSKGDDFTKAFGFRGVEFGNWEAQDERQAVMNHAYDALVDLSEVLNVPAKALGLNGELALAFGARGHGLQGARAHYERDYGVMNLTKMKGAGSLGHEWFHAMDHFFGRQDGKAKSGRIENGRGDKVFNANMDPANDYVSHGFRHDSKVREELRLAYKKLIETMYRKAEKFVEDTQRADRFVAETRDEVARELAAIRLNLSKQMDKTYYKRNNAPASAAQLAEFDTLADSIVQAESLSLEMRRNEKSRGMGSYRKSNDALDRLSAIYKAVRGRSGFDSTHHQGMFDRLGGFMSLYGARLKMLTDAKASTEKTRAVPTSYAMEAKSIDQGRTGDYWGSPHEMAARAFQAFIEDKIAEKGNRSDFLSYGTHTVIPTPWGFKKPYPEGAERLAINAEFQKFVDLLQTKETEAGTTLFSRQGENIGKYKFERATDKHGMPVYYNNEIGLARADLVAKPEPGVKRMLFAIMARKLVDRNGKATKVGYLQSDVNSDGVFKSVLNIRIYDEYRNKDLGYGESVIASMLASNGYSNPMNIEDIIVDNDDPKRDARGFWKKMGTRWTNYSNDPNVRMDGLLLLEDYLKARGLKSRLLRHDRRQSNDVARGIGGVPRQEPTDDAGATRRGSEAARGVQSPDGQSDSGGNSGGRGGSGRVGTDNLEIGEGESRVTQSPADAGLSVSRVKKWIAHVPARLRVEVVASEADLPVELRTDIQSQNAEGDVRGLFHSPTDTTYLIADKLTSQDEAVFVLMHESAHRGLRKLFGAELDPVLGQVYKTNANVRARADELVNEFGYSRVLAVEEVLADMAYLGQARKLTGWKRLVDAINQWLKKHGIDIVFSDDDVELIVGAAVRVGLQKPGAQLNLDLPAAEPSQASKFPNGDATVFSRTRPEWIDQQPAETQEALRKAGIWHQPPTLKARVANWKTDWQKRMRQGIADQFDPIKEYDYKAYMLARMTRGSDAALEALLNYGTIHLDQDGAVDVTPDCGFLPMMSKLNNEHDRFLSWVIGNRAERLHAEGREHNFTPQDIVRLKALNQGAMADGRSRQSVYAATAAELNRYNKAVVDIAAKAGLIDNVSRPLWEKDFYIPFYRVMDEANSVTGPKRSSGLVNQYAFKVLKGGAAEMGDPLENIMRNWSHLIDASLKNQAARESLTAAQGMGVAIEAPEETARQMAKAMKQKDAVVSFSDQGVKRWFIVEDPFLLDALRSIGFTGFTGPGMQVMGKFKRWLTLGVTVSPTFRIRNIIRDSLSMIGTNPADYNVLANVLTGWRSTKEGSLDFGKILAGGGVMRYGTFLEGDRAEHVKRLIQAGIEDKTVLDTEEKVKAMLRAAWDAWQHLGDRAENVNRAALYKTLRAQGKSHLEASFAARDVMDFSMQGTWGAIRFLSQTVPFMNARLQGLYKLGRGAVEDPKRFAVVTGAVTLASIALFLAYKDDDDWKAREDWDRETYWWFKVGKTAYRLPKPFEIGSLGTLAERGLEAMTTNELTGRQFADRVFNIVWQQLSMNPTPQLFQPVLELWANKDMFTDRPIETAGMEKLSKPERFGPNTSATAKVLGGAGGLSPAQIDHLVSGYFGWLGMHVVATADLALRPFTDTKTKPTARVNDLFVLGDFAQDLPTYQSKYVTRLYTQGEKYQELLADLHHYQHMGDKERVAEILATQRPDVQTGALYTKAQAQMSRINAQVLAAQNSSATPEAKRARLDTLYAMRNDLAKAIEEKARQIQR